MKKGMFARNRPSSSAAWILALPVLLSSAVADRSFAQTAYPLKAGSDRRHLVDQNNVPFLMNGDTPWSLIVKLTKAETELYLENRRQKGFNAIIVNLIEHYYGGPANRDGQQPFTTPGDFSTPNEAYFAHADWVIRKAEEKGILVVLAPAYLGYACGEEGWCQEMIANGPAKCRNYGRYLGNRYKSFKNILWMEGGDAAATGTALDALRAMTAGIREADPVHLHTAHSKRQYSALDSYDEPWLDVNTTYSDGELSPSKIKTDYNRARQMPFFYAEGDYEGENGDAATARRQAYWAILGGATGHFFGNHPLWEFASGWQSAMESAGSVSMKHLGNLFRSRSWSTLVPDYGHAVVTAGYGDLYGSSHAGVSRTSDGNSVIAYIPSSRTVTLDMTKVSGPESKAWWFNPSTGVATPIGTYPNAGSRAFTPGSGGDWVLVLDDAGLKLPAPGTAGASGNKVPSPPGNVKTR
jgi:hypothetical protein